MAEEKIKIHGGRILPDQEIQTGASDIQPQGPVRSHSPGETFHPHADKSEAAKLEPVVDNTHEKAKSEVEEATGMDQLEATPIETSPDAPLLTDDAPEPQAPTHHGPLKISKSSRSVGRFIKSVLVWMMVALLLVVAGALGAIYFLKI